MLRDQIVIPFILLLVFCYLFGTVTVRFMLADSWDQSFMLAGVTMIGIFIILSLML